MSDDKKTVKQETITAAMAKEALEKEGQKRAQHVMIELDKLLKENNCRLEPVVLIQGDRIASQVSIIPLE
jgi:hypothetical protein